MIRELLRGIVGHFLGPFLILLLMGLDAAGGQQRQQFVSAPKDQHVVEGATSVIECQVSNQRGRVQWAKDGFVLGFNRSIPGYHRYEMVGDGSDGIHHLKIRNTSLVDDAVYQCQVGPADGHPPIRATGKLIVLMAPSAMKLHSGGREDEIEVNEGAQVTLECHVENAKPVAAITWLKDGQEIRLDNVKEDIEESRSESRFNIHSRITVTLSAEDDRTLYACQASHRALEKPLSASLRISVLYPPGPPVITGYTEGENIRAGEERMLTCRSQGGNPLGRVRWYRDKEMIDTTDRQSRGESVNEYRFAVEAKDNGATFACRVKNKLTETPLVSAVTLAVLFPPAKVEVSGPTQARVGEAVSLRCVVENSNPPASVSWVVDGKPYPGAVTRNERSGGGGWHTVSALDVTVPAVDRNLMFTCHATNDALGKTSVDTFMLSVLRPPQQPQIYGYSDGVGMRVGQEQGLNCVSKGANPPAHLQWYRNGVMMDSKIHRIAEVSTAKISVVAAARDNGAHFRCEAHNSAASAPLSVNATLIVYFPPETVQVTVHPEHLRAGGQATLTCVAGPSNPPVQVSWYRGGYKLKGHLQETKDAPNNGRTVTNILVLNLTSTDDRLAYSCEAFNTATQTKTRDAVTLAVTYAPVFTSSPPTVVDLVVGDSLSLNLSARGNPEHVRYSWTHQGLSVPVATVERSRSKDFYEYRPPADTSRARITADGPLLNVVNVTVRDAGDYLVEARNEQGNTQANVYINVKYPIVIKDTSGTVRASLGSEATLSCEVDGNPLEEAMMEWRRPGYSFADTQQSFGSKKAVLRLLRVSRKDTGVFTCLAHNGVIGAPPAAANVSLVVSAKPVINKSKVLSVAAAKVGSTGRLTCEASGAPAVHFAWRKNGQEIPHNFYDGKFINETVKRGLVTYTSTLEIRRVVPRDLGHYECVASNPLGTATTSVHFTEPTRPQPPLSLKVVNSTHDSVTVHWEPGFDGGATQYFRLRYRAKGQRLNEYSYLDVYEPGATTYTVTGLVLGTEYYFSIMSRNQIGNTDYLAEFVRAFTSNELPKDHEEVVLLNQLLEDRGHIPQLVIIVVAIVGTAVVIINIALVICLVRRKAGRRRDDGSDVASSKGTSNTMYAPSSYNDAPSSYNDTVVGETLSSISEKSRESYAQDDSVGEYEDASRKSPPSATYLIDQIEPPPEYASQTPSSQPSSAAYDPNEDDYAEVLRRNAYNHQLGKGTPRPPSRATHYSTSPDSRGYISYSYTPSPTGVPNGAAHYHAGTLQQPSVSLGLQDGASYHRGAEPLSVEALESQQQQQSAIHSLGLDTQPPPPLGLEQHSLSSEHPSLTLDHNSITIDHPVLNDLSRNGDLLRGGHTPPSLSTFHPNPSPSTYSESEMEGHLV